jgi:precorrin-4/cobalt-precorrin-4 C11-methyltransferase
MVNFVGAGPGAVDLITVRGRLLLEQADVVIYTGSLVWIEHLKFCQKSCVQYNSASMTLEEVITIIEENFAKKQKIVRLHTGDPTLFGAIREQMTALDQKQIPYTIVPGVSSFTASCAALNREFTLPGITQTVIVTRIEGRTPVPATEDLELLASHQSSMAIFLSVQNIERVVAKLISGYKSDQIPIAIVYKASWPEQQILKGKLNSIVAQVKAAGFKGFSQILVGRFIGDDFERSQLYHPQYSHTFRKTQER